MLPEPHLASQLIASLDELAETGASHLKRCGVRREQRTRRAALGLYDRHLRLRDRLVTADEFIRLHAPFNGFVAAAVDDAAQFVSSARRAELERIEIEKRPHGWRLYRLHAVFAALALVALILWLVRYNGPSRLPDSAPVPLSVAPASGADSDERPPDAMRSSLAQDDSKSGRETSDVRLAGSSRAFASAHAERGHPSAVPGRSEEPLTGRSAASSDSRSSPGAGPASNADASEGQKVSTNPTQTAHHAESADLQPAQGSPNEAREFSGDASSQQQNANERLPGRGNRHDAGDRQHGGSPSPQQDEKQQGSQGAAAGNRGSQPAQRSEQTGAQSSSSNPVAQSSRAQGRGQGAGTEALKKSRGVASMILGVPTPDRVPGLRNPGPVRTVQKKTLPAEEQVGASRAESRGARASPIGPIERPDMRPWMKRLVRDYFSADAGKP